jgi:hypothetical protein
MAYESRSRLYPRAAIVWCGEAESTLLEKKRMERVRDLCKILDPVKRERDEKRREEKRGEGRNRKERGEEENG